MNALSALTASAPLWIGVVAFQTHTVVPDKDNVVASRLEGDGVPDLEIGERLGTQAKEKLSFKADASVLDRIPPKLLAYLKEKQIFLAGTLTIGKLKAEEPPQVMPAVVIEAKGNSTLVCYLSRGGKEIDDGESGILMLATAADKARDMLFMGGDFNNEPMRAWKRKAP